MASKMQKPYIDTKCQSCSQGFMKEPSNGQEWHLVCDECEAILFCYTPMPHQARFHADPAKFRLYAGG